MILKSKYNLKINSQVSQLRGHKPDEAVSIGAATALPGALAVLPRAAEPDVLVTHLEVGLLFF